MQVAGTRVQRDYKALSRLSLELLGWEPLFAGEHSSPLRNHQWQRRNQISRALSRDCRRHSSRAISPAFSLERLRFSCTCRLSRSSPLTFDSHLWVTACMRVKPRCCFCSVAHYLEIKIIARYLKSRLFFLLSRVQFDDDCVECFGKCRQSEGAIWTYGS